MSNITPPTTLDKLEESLDTRFRDVFISYGRAESKAFATKLCKELTEKGYKVWFDQNDIPLGVDFQQQIDEGIETAHNFIFIIAPHAVKSPYCRKEIELAVKRGKRIIPILHIEPTEKEVWELMHPAVGKINWVYMRQKWEKEKEQTEYETIDDFDIGFESIISLLKQHEKYVKQHTQILFRAIEWEKNHHNSMHLLVANERQQAEEWLFERFDGSQPPCLPSDLHVRFISEAKKNANNLQTDVFIASAEKEKEGNSMTREQIIYSLALYGYTSWTHVNDLNSGVDFHKAIKKGVEGADNLIFMITKESLKSEYCMEELEYAISLNKRIIPLRLEKIAESELPVILKDIQYIDFVDNEETISLSKNEKTDFEKDIDDLLKILDTDKEYIQRNKILLTQALKWQRQEKNPSMLLRGHNLEQAKIWLKIGEKRDTNIPLPIHEEFIKESQAKSSSERTDVFVSYSRTDGDIARKINESLQIAGKTTWFDQESIASGADFQKEIYLGIQNADNIVFILSPESILSPYCADEVEYAQKLGKRFVTLLYREIDSKELHSALSAVQWIDFRPKYTKFEKQFAEVLRTLDTDREHVQAHTKWQNEAMEWISFDKNNDFLLRGNELLLANTWRENAKESKKIPPVTDLQDEFIKESLKQEGKIQLAIERNKQIAIATIAIIFAVAILAGSQWYKSFENQKELAIRNMVFESKDLIELYPKEAVELAYEAYKSSEEKDLVVIKNLYHHVESEFLNTNNFKYTIDNQPIDKNTPLFIELKVADTLIGVMASEDKSSFIAIDDNFKLSLFDKQDGFISELEGTLKRYNYTSTYDTILNISQNFLAFLPSALAISPNGKKIAAQMVTPQNDKKIILFDQNGRPLKTLRDTNDDLDYALDFKKFSQYPDSTFLILSYNKPYQDNGREQTYTTLIYTENGQLLDTLRETGFGKINQIDTRINIESKIWYKELIKKTVSGDFKKSPLFLLDNSNNYQLSLRDKNWELTNKNKLIATYKFPKDALFSSLKTENYLVVYDNYNYTASIFLYPDLLKPLFQKIEPLSAEERIYHQIATLDDYKQVPYELADVTSKALLFLTVFLLSILVLNYMNILILAQKYFKVLIYLIVGFGVGLGWFLFIMNEEYIIKIAFSSAIALSIAGMYYGRIDIKKRLYFNGFLYFSVGVLLFIGASAIFYYTTTSDGFMESAKILLGWINVLLVTVVGILWLATEKASYQFYQRNFIYFSDWIGIIVFTISLFILAAITDMLSQDNTYSLFLPFILPLSYFLRTLVHHSVLYTYQKTPYSLTILRSYIPFVILIVAFGIGLIINFNNSGENYLYTISAIGLAFYTPLLYIFTIFVAYKQKDKLNIRANSILWLVIVTLIFILPFTNDSFTMYHLISVVAIIISFPISWWIYKDKKKKNTLPQNQKEVLNSNP